MANSVEMLAELLSALRETLEEERRLLLSGSPALLAGNTEQKLRLAERIDAACRASDVVPPDIDTVLALDRYNRGNAVICTAMLRNLMRTLDRLRQRDCHRSYGPDGSEQGAAPPSRLGAA
jgi:hypothetical protein